LLKRDEQVQIKTMNRVSNNFNSECFYTSSTGKDLKEEIKKEAQKHGKKPSDFFINKQIKL
jgi:hypothetical protein